MAREVEVDVVVPVLNGGPRLARCLRAIRDQEGVRARCIVVDNGSTDGSHGVAADLASLLLDEPRRGSYVARNSGLAVATAPVIAFTDADCVPDPHWLRSGLDTLSGCGWDLCAGAVRQETAHTLAGRHDELTYLDQCALVASMGFGATANLFVRRHVFDDVGLFDPHLRSGGDMDFGRRAVRAGKTVGYAPDAVVSHTPREGLRPVLRKAWRIGVGHAEVSRRDREILHWGVSPLRLLPSRSVVRRYWRQPAIVAVDVLVKWVSWAARVVTLLGPRGAGAAP